jgi:outer membrane lipoprotein LolB
MVVAGWLAGCATRPPLPPVADPDLAWQTRLAELQGASDWEVKAKLAVRTHERGGQASMLWQRQMDAHRVNLYGPFGGGRVILTSDSQGATLRDSRKQSYNAVSAEAVLYRVVGWRIPFERLQYWVLGVPAPGLDYTHTLDERGRLAILRQDGWEIIYQEYDQFAGREMPRKMSLQAAGTVTGLPPDDAGRSRRVEVRAVIKRWRL